MADELHANRTPATPIKVVDPDDATIIVEITNGQAKIVESSTATQYYFGTNAAGDKTLKDTAN